MKTITFVLAFLAGLGFTPPLAGQATANAAAAKAPVARLTILGDNAVARDGVKAVWGFACLLISA